MCGLFCVVERTPVDINTFKLALNTMQHRGPDATGTFSCQSNTIVLGHQRLSIVGLTEKGNQPYISKSRRFIIVYNGEIFNFRELASKYNITLESDCDTELVIELYELLGSKVFAQFNGMFAMVLYDSLEKKLIWARDRFGIKPLYIFRKNSTLILSSEIEPIFTYTNMPRQENLNVISTYLCAGLYDHTENTFFDDIISVKPGYCVEYVPFSNELDEMKWFDIESFHEVSISKYEGLNYEDLRENVSLILDEAIALALNADVNVGLNVSGGIDSALLAHYAHKSESKSNKLFTMDFPYPYSECEWVQKYLAQYGSLRAIKIDINQIYSNLEEMMRWQMQPYGGITVNGYHQLYTSARENGIKVLLDGNGIDEVFLGYEKYRLNFDNISTSIDGTISVFPDFCSEDLYHSSNILYGKNLTRGKHEKAREISILDLISRKIPRGLRFNDIVSMRNSCELRVPFLDNRLVEIGLSLNSKYLLHANGTKYILRDLVNSKIDVNLGSAPKRSVQSPQRELFRNSWSILVEEILSSRNSIIFDWFDYKKFRSYFDEYLNGEHENSFPVWQLVNLHFWSSKCLLK